jgi:hypothetical protein
LVIHKYDEQAPAKSTACVVPWANGSCGRRESAWAARRPAEESRIEIDFTGHGQGHNAVEPVRHSDVDFVGQEPPHVIDPRFDAGPDGGRPGPHAWIPRSAQGPAGTPVATGGSRSTPPGRARE